MAMAAAAQPTPEGLARLEELREEAYTKVLRAFTQQTFHWGREKVLGNLRKELHIGNDAHAEIMDCVLSGKDPPRVAAAAVARAQPRQQPARQGEAQPQNAGFGGPAGGGRGGGGGSYAHAYAKHGSPSGLNGSGMHSARRPSAEAGALGMPAIPTSQPGGAGYPPHAAQQLAGGHGGHGQWQRGGMSPHQQMAHQQQHARQTANGGYMLQQQQGHPQHSSPQQHGHYGSPTLAQHQRSGGFPQLPHHQMRSSPQGAPRPGDYAPTYMSPMDAYGGSQPLPAPQQQAQQRYGGAGAARELWPPQPGGHPIAQQHGHVGMPGSGGQYMEGYGAGVSGAGSPTGAHAAGAYAASPSGGGAGRQPKGGFGGSPQGLGGNGNGKPSRGRPPVTKKRPAEGAAPPKQPKKKKGEGQSPALPSTDRAPIAAAASLKLDPLLGHRVKVYWATAGGWWDGVITDFNMLTGQHCVVYDYGTPDESFEWTQIRGAKGGEVQVLDDTVDLLQGRPHGSGVPKQTSHTTHTQQPPKAAAKPGRKPKAAPAAGSSGGGSGVPNGRHTPAVRAPPPKVRPQAPNGNAPYSDHAAADSYREQYPPQPALPQQYQQSHRPPPPVQDDGYGFRVVGENTDSDSGGEEYSDESYD